MNLFRLNMSCTILPDLLLSSNVWKEKRQREEECSCPSHVVPLWSQVVLPLCSWKKVKNKTIWKIKKAKNNPDITPTHKQSHVTNRDVLSSSDMWHHPISPSLLSIVRKIACHFFLLGDLNPCTDKSLFTELFLLCPSDAPNLPATLGVISTVWI